MAHTDPEPKSEPPGIIQQKPPPPPRREGDPSEPAHEEQPQQPAIPSLEAAPTQPTAPRVAEAHGPGSSRRHRRPPSGHVIIPARESDPEIISRAGTRPRMDSAPALLLIDYPRATSGRAVSRATSYTGPAQR